MADMIIGRNAVLEALKSGRGIERLTVAKGAGGSLIRIAGMAKEKKIPVDYREKQALDRMAGGGSHQGVIARVSAYAYCQVEDILRRAGEREEDPLIIILDGIEDPHNLGAIMRTAECCGAHGIIIPKHHAADITETVVKASAGAVEYMLCARVTNLARTIDSLKEAGLWIAACDMNGQLYTEQDLTGALALVIGSEGFGISRLVREKCDFVVSLPMKGRITSLNASNAAAVCMYEVIRQRNGKTLR